MKPDKPSPTYGQLMRWCMGTFLDRTRMFRLLETKLMGSVVILNYHRVLPRSLKSVSTMQHMILDQSTFEHQLKYISRNYKVITLEEAVELLGRKDADRNTYVAVTFDDGYKDFYSCGYPILKKHGVPATVFITTGVIEGGGEFWWDRFSRLILAVRKHTELEDFRAVSKRWNPTILSYVRKLSGDFTSSIPYIDLIIRHLVRMKKNERMRFLQDIDALAEKAGCVPLENSPYLSWSEIKEMQREGISIGAHTMKHLFLDECEEEEVKAEINGSAEKILHGTGKRPAIFSFPGGRLNRDVVNIVKESGYLGAATTEHGINHRGCDLFRLKRIDAGYFNINDHFYESMMRLELINGFRGNFRSSSDTSP